MTIWIGDGVFCACNAMGPSAAPSAAAAITTNFTLVFFITTISSMSDERFLSQ
jgi:hypothetical protein